MKNVIYWIDGPWLGRLAIVPRPRGGDWLGDEIDSWRAAGMKAVVSALTSEEVQSFELCRESELIQATGMEHIAFPIPDRGVPGSLEAIDELARRLYAKLARGKNVAIHCRQGIGRSSLIAASVLVYGAIDPDEAFARIERSRGCSVPDTPEQREWIVRFAIGARGVVKT